MRAQAEVLRSALPGATVIDDASIDVAGGVAAWPKNPILFGGAHVNRVVAALAPVLPLSADETRIEIGGARIDAPGSRIVAIVPARAADPAHPGHPTLLLYAGLGTPGITEINGGMRHGGEPILIGDSFGRLRTGVWSAAPDGGLRAALGEPARRDTWRRSSRDVAGVAMTIAFPSGLEATPDDERVVDAVGRGLASSAKRLALTAPPPLTVYVYPNREAKKALTGDGGDGHAMVIGRTLHVRRADAAPGGGLERLVAHEGTHVFAAEAWGGTGSALMGEGLAVWVSGAYQGKPLSEWAKTLTPRPPIASLLPLRAFRARPEAETYPLGGLLVTAAVARVGLENVRDHLYSAGAEDWAAACVRAGTSAEQLDHDLAAMK
jgi:hypothetical protein